MNVLNHLAQAAAVLLLLELLVVLLIFAGVAGGLAFGLRWVRGKTDVAFTKAQAGLKIGDRYAHSGLDYLARPFILASGAAETVKGTAQALRREVRTRWERSHPQNIIPPPVLDGDTQVVGAHPVPQIPAASAGMPSER